VAQAYPVPHGASFAYGIAAAALDEQLRRIEALDSKAGILIAADGVLTGLLFSESSLLLTAPRVISAVAVSLVVLSLLLALVAFANRRYRIAPHPPAVVRLMAAPENWLRWRFIGNLEEARVENDNKLRWKARFVTAALASLLGAVALLGGYFLVAIAAGWLG
jgi:hypothetical protein